MTKKSKQVKQQEEKSYRSEIINQMVTLSTSGFGLVAALAWNSAIQTLVKNYLGKFFSDSSGTISQFIYAILITLLAVTITYQLSKLAAKMNSFGKKSNKN